jgi:TadE-like protein
MNRLSPQKGASAVEFALVVTLLLAVLFGLMDWSWYMYHWLSVTTSAARGARIAAGVPLSQDPVSRAQGEAEAWLELYRMRGAPTIQAEIQDRGYSKILRVQVEVPYQPLIGLVPTPPMLRGSAEVLWYGDVGVP